MRCLLSVGRNGGWGALDCARHRRGCSMCMNDWPPPVTPPLWLCADFRATCCQYIKAVFSMPGGITDQTAGSKAVHEQVRC